MSKQLNILSINTTSKIIDVVLSYQGKISYIEKDTSLNNYEDIVSLIKDILTRTNLKLNDIDYFGVCVGPGSFTGIRMGLSAMKALSYSMGKPLIGFTSLDLEAYTVREKSHGLLCIMQDAKRNNVYGAIFNNNKSLSRISQYLLVEAVQLLKKVEKFSKRRTDLYFYGDVVCHYKDTIHKNFPNSRLLEQESVEFKSKAMIALTKNNIKNKVSPFKLMPLYLYPRDCQVTKPSK